MGRFWHTDHEVFPGNLEVSGAMDGIEEVVHENYCFLGEVFKYMR